MNTTSGTRLFCFAVGALLAGAAPGAEWPDLSSVAPDLDVPALSAGAPAPGRRVAESLPSWRGTPVHHVLYLPADWQAGAKFPVLVEFAGNGGYSNRYGDVSAGTPEGSRLGYGLSAGRGFLWICVPFLNGQGSGIATQWWGDRPAYDPAPTMSYCTGAVAWVCSRYGGDPSRVILCGFSRGAIACNFIGLHDDAIAKLWRGFIPFSHYDGVRAWPYPGSDRTAAIERLKRLGARPQFVCMEGDGVAATKSYLAENLPGGNFSFAQTGFRNHNDAWVLRPCEARDRARRWLAEVTAR